MRVGKKLFTKFSCLPRDCLHCFMRAQSQPPCCCDVLNFDVRLAALASSTWPPHVSHVSKENRV